MSAFDDLIDILTDETILPFSKLSVISALGRSGDKRAVPYLIEALQSENHYMRRESARALGMLANPEAVEPLIDAVDIDKDNEVRRNAIVSLGQLGDERAGEILTQAMEENSFLIRRAAEASLKQIRGEQAETARQYSRTPTTPTTQVTGTEMPSTRYTTLHRPEAKQTTDYGRTPVAQQRRGTTASTRETPLAQRSVPRTTATRSAAESPAQYTQLDADTAMEQDENSDDIELNAADIARHQQRVSRSRRTQPSQPEAPRDTQIEPENAITQLEEDEMELGAADIAQGQQEVGRTPIPLSSEAGRTPEVQPEPGSASEQWDVEEDESTEPDPDVLIRDAAARQAENYETPPPSSAEATQMLSSEETTQTQGTTGQQASTQTRVYDDNAYVQVQMRTSPEELPPQPQPRANWKCPNCGEVISGDFQDCWNCGAGKSGSESLDYEAAESLLAESDINIINCPQCGAEMLEGVLFIGENELTFNYRRNNQTNDIVIDKDVIGRVCLKCHLISLKF